MTEKTFRSLMASAIGMTPFPDERFPPSPYYRFMRVLAREMEPVLSVELGVCGGGGSFHLAIGWQGGTVVGVENCPGSDHEKANWKYLDEFCPNFEFWRGDSVDSAEDIFNRHGKVDILFIDTVHTYERTMQEFKAWQPYMSRRGVVLMDDLFRPGMEDAWHRVPGQKVRLDDLHPGAPPGGGGFGVVWGFQ